MPKFMTYQRPAPVSKQNWNHAPDRKTDVPRKAPEQQKPAGTTITVPVLERLLRED